MIQSPLDIDYQSLLSKLKSLNTPDYEGNLYKIIISTFNNTGLIGKNIYSLYEFKNCNDDKLVNNVNKILESDDVVGFFSIPEKDKHLSANTYIVEIIKPVKSLVILGAGHVGRCVAALGDTLGFNTTLVDDRQEFLSNKRSIHSSVKTVLSSYNDYPKSVAITPSTAIVIVTRGHQFDEICLRVALQSEARYIGMIGSKRRVLSIINSIKKSSLTKEEYTRLDRLYAPIGLPIGAKTPQEIAISILAQIIQVLSNNTQK